MVGYPSRAIAVPTTRLNCAPCRQVFSTRKTSASSVIETRFIKPLDAKPRIVGFGE